jgi:hypothetical protein
VATSIVSDDQSFHGQPSPSPRSFEASAARGASPGVVSGRVVLACLRQDERAEHGQKRADSGNEPTNLTRSSVMTVYAVPETSQRTGKNCRHTSGR